MRLDEEVKEYGAEVLESYEEEGPREGGEGATGNGTGTPREGREGRRGCRLWRVVVSREEKSDVARDFHLWHVGATIRPSQISVGYGEMENRSFDEAGYPGGVTWKPDLPTVPKETPSNPFALSLYMLILV
ncbi:uncharacterized protein STEHIDRAFT_159214 [Stereum hirsutum FP-91666 SS1]|uniref:uncharacterized protein n=1 Tax=Stereum hirsutum (strain FP-91666) TaxID=721885 RepID=UPI0004449A93|nr:uncharacterized protein STEHIDRAFT_159214 [Stereum hirsutum FP-91666 SS1]EIM84547.1 hypothetical protein STEHIDRAFT_159214 [Stereum hirsutum FP-91666 SS1]